MALLFGHAKKGDINNIHFLRDFNKEWDAESIGTNTFIPWSFMDTKNYGDDYRISLVYVLKRSETNVLADNPVRSTELTEMTFDWDRLEVPPPGTVISMLRILHNF